MPDGEEIAFNDLNLGPQCFVAGKDFGDFIVWRRDGNLVGGGIASYQLACVVDDAAMQMTEVVRGADLLKQPEAPAHVQPVAAAVLGDRHPVHEFHDEIGASVRRDAAVDPRRQGPASTKGALG